MNKRYMTLSEGQRVPLGIFVQGIKKAIANPDAEFKCGLTTWWPVKGSEIRNQFMGGIMDRINQGVPYTERGLK